MSTKSTPFVLFASLLMYLCLGTSASAQELFTEMRAQVRPDRPAYTFRVLGDKEISAFSAYGIHIIDSKGKEQMLDQFDALLPDGSEIDVLYIEDFNFDGYADIRLVKYLTGGANVPYLFWLYQPDTDQFVAAPKFEVILSPEIDASNKQLISRQRSSAAEYSNDFYTVSGDTPQLVRHEERTYRSDGSSVLKVYRGSGASRELVETKNLPPE